MTLSPAPLVPECTDRLRRCARGYSHALPALSVGFGGRVDFVPGLDGCDSPTANPQFSAGPLACLTAQVLSHLHPSGSAVSSQRP